MVRQCLQLRFARGTMAQVRANARSTTKEIVQAQLCPVLSLSLSISISLSIWMLSRSPVARVARHKSMLHPTKEAHTHKRATCSTSHTAHGYGYWQHDAALQCSLLSRDLMSGVPLINPAATH
jgi:hypothetical protein